MATVILEPKKIKSVTVSMFPHLFAMKWWNQSLYLTFNCLILLNETTPTDIELWVKYLAVLFLFLAINMFFHQNILERSS